MRVVISLARATARISLVFQRAFYQNFFVFVGWDRAGEVVALHFIATEAEQHIGLFAGFHALGDYGQTQRVVTY